MTAKHIVIALLAAFVAAVAIAPAPAAGVMNEQQARVAAVKILKGDPYGKTDRDVLRNITAAQLITAGSVCGRKVAKPLWQFQVVVPKERNPSGENEIKGYLVIDAQTGKIDCAGLPFLD